MGNTYDFGIYDRRMKQNFRTIKRALIAICILGILLTLVVLSVGTGASKSIDNQNEMLCNSAKISGNRDWGNACAEYYETGKIEYLRKIK